MSERVFVEVKGLIGRGAIERQVKKKPEIDRDNERARLHTTGFLRDQELKSYCRNALAQSLGITVEISSPFPSMIWYGGARDTWKGFRFLGNFGDFIHSVLTARSTEIAQKQQGWVVTPTTNTDGHRVNASTVAMHAVNLDCDERGTWDALLSVLNSLEIAYIVYQSGGWSPIKQKWHLLVPLTIPFDTSSQEKIEAWKSAYHSARVVFGALGDLVGEGFDPTCETPSQPVFITERRSSIDPPRQIVWRPGRSLDIHRLTTILPKDPPRPPREIEDSLDDENYQPGAALDDDKLEQIVEALCRPMSKIMGGRRDLYLALPGALLDRGLVADDVLAIVEEVSSRCPGDPRYTPTEVDSKHREHVHCAQTTISRFENGQEYTRIGTLASSWPEVARAIDDSVPDPEVEAVRDALATWSVRRLPPKLAEIAPTPQHRVVVNLNDVDRRLKNLRRRKLQSKNPHEKVKGVIIDSLLCGEDLVPRMRATDGTPRVVYDEKGREIDQDRALYLAMSMVAFRVPVGTPFGAIAEIARLSIFAMSKSSGTTTDVLRNRAERAYLKAVGQKMSSDDKKHTTQVQDRCERL